MIVRGGSPSHALRTAVRSGHGAALGFFALISTGTAVATLLSPGCSTGAAGIEACRAIETARCDAVPACEGDDPSFGIATEEQIRNCKVFYNDHCLLGLENATEDPSQDTVDDCVAAIAAVAKCQRDAVETIAACTTTDKDGNTVAVPLVDDATVDTPCEALEKPEQLADCAFVEAPPEED